MDRLTPVVLLACLLGFASACSTPTMNDQASVHFVSHSAQVRDALEQSVPRLREMLEAGGFALVDSQVSDQSDRSGSDGQRQGSGNEPLVDAAQEEVKATAVPEGAIDFYA